MIILQGTGTNQTLSVEFELRNGDRIFVCGYKQKDSLKHADIFIELDVPYFPTEADRKNYISGSGSDNLPIKWVKRHHIGGDTECTKLYQVPHGHHILTISTGENKVDRQRYAAALTHVITF